MRREVPGSPEVQSISRVPRCEPLLQPVGSVEQRLDFPRGRQTGDHDVGAGGGLPRCRDRPSPVAGRKISGARRGAIPDRELFAPRQMRGHRCADSPKTKEADAHYGDIEREAREE